MQGGDFFIYSLFSLFKSLMAYICSLAADLAGLGGIDDVEDMLDDEGFLKLCSRPHRWRFWTKRTVHHDEETHAVKRRRLSTTTFKLQPFTTFKLLLPRKRHVCTGLSMFNNGK